MAASTFEMHMKRLLKEEEKTKLSKSYKPGSDRRALVAPFNIKKCPKILLISLWVA